MSNPTNDMMSTPLKLKPFGYGKSGCQDEGTPSESDSQPRVKWVPTHFT